MHLFTYGTLMFPEVWRRVAAKRRQSHPATLHGYVRRRAKDQVYPVIFRSGGADYVNGLVYFDVAEVIARIDAFESPLYRREEVEAYLPEGERLSCQAYVLPETAREAASHEPWDREAFEARSLARYLRQMEVWGY